MGALDRRRPLTQANRTRAIAMLEADAPRRSRMFTTAALLVPALMFFLVAYVWPLGALLYDSFESGGRFTVTNHIKNLASPAFHAILLRTLQMSLMVAVLCLLVGYPLAYALSKLKGTLVAFLLLLVTIPYVTSILIRTYAWIVILSGSGIVNKTMMSLGIIETPLQLVFNQLGVYVGMVQVQLPLMIFPLYAVLTKIDHSLAPAAYGLGSSPASAFWHVTLPLSFPGIASGFTLVFLSCLGFYVTPALLGGTGEYMLAQGISVRVLTLGDFDSASTQAASLLVVVIVLFLLFRRRIGVELDEGERRPAREHDAGSGLRHWPAALEWVAAAFGGWLSSIGVLASWARRLLLWPLAVMTLLFLTAPLLVVIPLAFSDAAYLTFPPPGYSLRWFHEFFDNQQWIDAAIFSARTAVLATALSLAIGVPAAFAIVRRGFSGRIGVYLLLISPLVVPHVVVAVALFFQLAPAGMSGTTIAFIISYTLIGIPYVVVVCIAGLRRFDRTLEMAAASLGASPAIVLRTVTLPLLLPSLVSAGLFAFIVGFDDVVFGLFLSGANSTPLPIRMWDDIRLEISPQIAVVAVLLFIMLALGYGLILAIRTLSRSEAKSGNFD